MSELNLLYVHAGWIGYGRVGVNLHEQLTKMGVKVYDHLEGSEAHYSERLPPQFRGTNDDPRVVAQNRDHGRSNVCCWVSVPSHGTGWYEGQIPMIFTMWEGMRLPESFRESLHEFETCIVPSMQNVELFSQYHNNVKYVPLGIDSERWKLVPDRPKPTKEFRFLIGGSGKRKGADLAVKAFKTLWGKDGSWGDGPIPTLTCKSPKGEAWYGDRIQTIGGYLEPEDEIALYANAHCYLQPSRGEGFGLQPLQAIAQGLPTILTDAHGHEAFSEYGLPISASHTQSDYFIFGDAGDWWEPNFDELCDRMRDVYDDYDHHWKRAVSSSRVVHRDFNWTTVTDLFLDAVGRDLLTPYSGNGDWHGADAKQFHVKLKQDWYHEVAECGYSYKAGKDYWVPADVKRILFEADKLHKDCIVENDHGLTDDEIARYHKDQARYENCPTCGKPL